MNRFFTLLLAASCLTAVGQGEISTCSDTLVIGDSQDFDSYLWNTGETGQFLTVTDAGTYTRSNFNVSSTELDFFAFDNEEKIEIAHDEALDFGSGPFTIQLWYRNFGGATSLQSTVIDKYGKSGCTSSQMWMLLIRGTEEQYAGHLIFEGRQNSTTVSLFSNFPVDDGQWHHIVVQRTEVLSLFVDGELQEQSVAGADWIFDNDEVVQIGGGHCGRYTPGNIGPLTIHNTALFGEGAVDYSPEDSSTATLYVSPNSIFGEYACTWENAVVDVSSNVVTDSFTEDTETLHSVVEYNVQFLVNGCMDVYACNFDPEAACDDGSCDYTCCPGPGCCDQGLTWNWELSLCQDLNPADINLDGCVQLNDLLDLLSAYGDCGAEEEASGFALSFDGVNDHVDFGNASIGNVEDVTFEVLMKTGSDSEGLGSNYQALLSKDCNGCEFSTGDWAILIGHNGNGVASFTINNSSGVAAVESGALNDEEWHWISVTRNATTGLVHLYVDGVEVDSDIGPVGLVHNEEKMYLAKYFLTSPSHYEGLIGEFRVWNRELTDIEIGTYLGAELQGNESGLVGLWNFSEGEGDVLTDQTNGGLNGQIIEATWTPATETP